MIDYGELSHIFRQIAQEHGHEYATKLRSIVDENIARGRLAWYLQQNRQHTVVGYIEKVLAQYNDERDFIASLQLHHHNSVWADVQCQARTKAYHLLARLGFPKDVCTSVSDDIAQDVCIQILHAHYPYDSVFEAWLAKMCVHIGYKYAHKRWAYEKSNVDVEKAGYLSHEHPQQKRQLEVLFYVDEHELKNAIKKLSLLQQEVIEKHYMQGISLAAISDDLGVIPNVIYKRHSDARKRLSKILGK